MKNKKESYITSMNNFCKDVYDIALSDRDVNLGVGGFTGEGKSCFLTQFFFEYGKITGTAWKFNNMTWSRKELIGWIDGDKKGKYKQMPQFSGILVDELFMLFYKRNWYDEGQIDAIATLNMCRDRHLVIGGNIPNFWELDASFNSRIRFYAYIPYRGVAWIFEQENNPFSTDVWNRRTNEKLFRKFHNKPYLLKNFLCEIHYKDWTPSQKKKYYEIRNKKRLTAIDSNKTEKIERYKDIKEQRDNLIRMIFATNKKLTNKDLADVTGLSTEAVRLIRHGIK